MAEGPPSIFSVASRSKKLFTSFALFYSFFTLGISLTFLNPTVVDFSHKLNVSVEEVAVVFTVLTSSYLTGSLLAGVIIPVLNRQIWVTCCLIVMTFPFFIVPYVHTKNLFFIMCGLIGLGIGGADCALMAWIIDIWRAESGPYILTIYFAGSVGTLFPPLLHAPFLNTGKDIKHGEVLRKKFSPQIDKFPPQIEKLSSHIENLAQSIEDLPGQLDKFVTQMGLPRLIGNASTKPENLPYESRLSTPFFVAGGILGLAIIFQIILYLVYRNAPAPGKDLELKVQNGENSKEENPRQEDSLHRRILLVVLTCLVIGVNQAMDATTSQFFATFCHFSPVSLSEADAARVLFGLQLGFAGGRLLGIFLVVKIAAYFLLVGNLILLMGATAILFLIGSYNVTWLWVGAISMGAGLSTVLPAVFTFVERYLFVTDTVTASMYVFGGLVAAVYPLIVGRSVDSNPEVLLYVNGFSITVSVVAFSILFCVTWVRARRRGGQEKDVVDI